jgi:hypothetical protein
MIALPLVQAAQERANARKRLLVIDVAWRMACSKRWKSGLPIVFGSSLNFHQELCRLGTDWPVTLKALVKSLTQGTVRCAGGGT